MAPYLTHLLADPLTASIITPSPTLLEELRAKNVKELEGLEVKLEDAVKNLGETEVSDALRAKALYLARIGEKVSKILSLSFPLD
jgi:26S proteasome regulatory subunit N7